VAAEVAAEVATLGRRLAVLAKQKALLCVEECLLRALSVLNRDGPIRHHPVRAEFIEAQALERRALRRPAGSPLGGHAQGERTSDKARAVTATQGCYGHSGLLRPLRAVQHFRL